MFCNNCGTRLPDNATFCGACGSPVVRLGEDEPSAASSPAPAQAGVAQAGASGAAAPAQAAAPAAPTAAQAMPGAEAQGKRRSPLPLVAGILVGVAALAALVVFVIMPALGRSGSSPNANGTNTSAEAILSNNHYVSDGTWLYYIVSATTPSKADGTFSIVAQIRRMRLNGSDDQVLYTYQHDNCDGDEYVELRQLYLADGRVYFIQEVWGTDTYDMRLRSVTTDGTDLVDVMQDPPNLINISDGRLFLFFDDGVSSSPLPGHEGDSFWVYRTDGSDEYVVDWAVDDGYVYFIENEYVPDEYDRYFVRRCSLEDGQVETIYASTDSSIWAIAPYDGRIYLVEHVRDSNYVNQLVSIDIETGSKTVLFVEDEDDYTRELAAWSVTADGIYVTFNPYYAEEPFVLYEVAPDGSGMTAVYTYDSAWAGNALRTRNYGADPLAVPYGLFVCNGKAFFVPVSWDLSSDFYADDSEAPTYTSICSVDLDDGSFEVVSTVPSVAEFE